MNATETSCMVECCNTTACLNATLKSLNTSAGTTMAPSATTTAQSSATTAANLKKVVSGSEMTWTASCSNSCLKSGLVTCSSTAVDCMQECCNATSTASCLKLNGSVNMPSSAGPATVPSLMALLTAALLVWVFNGQPWSPLRQ
ncbi:uncharacterized protein LOC136762759 [Amia ocellicauda]|uniref:uncharacterized protein LOC136762759 n=1 Tax=Amia ocellicauda TaxID=2972642 RepID=UPI00346401DD